MTVPHRWLRGAAHGALILAIVGGTSAFAVLGSTSDAGGSGGFATGTPTGGVARAEAPTSAAETRVVTSRTLSSGRTAIPRAVALSADGASRIVTTDALTVADILAEAGVALGADDEVSVPLSAAPPAGEAIVVARVTYADVTELTEIGFETTETADPTLAVGQRSVETAGSVGVETVVFSVKLVDGIEVSREEVLRTATAPVPEIVSVGTKVAARTPTTSGGAPGVSTTPVVAGDPRAIAQAMVAARGWSTGEFACLDALFKRESNWNPSASNASSGAYGIPQALPGSKMATVSADWRTNPATQITWGLNYIAGRYGTPCGAWAHSQSTGWY